MKLQILSFVGLALAFTTQAHAQDIRFDLMHTAPNCNYPGKASTWCKDADNKRATEDAGMVDRINSILDKYGLDSLEAAAKVGSVPHVYIGYLSFSNSYVPKKLCQLAKMGIPIDIVLDYGSLGQADKVLECSANPGKPNVTVNYLGGLTSDEAWRLHHNKYLVVDPGDGSPVAVNFSSGNLSGYGTGLHLDHWVVMEAPRDSNLVKAQLCVAESLQEAITLSKKLGMYKGGSANPQYDEKVAQTYISALGNCYQEQSVIPMTKSEQALKAEGIAPMFSPNNNDEVFRVFKSEVDKVVAEVKKGRPAFLYIAIQHFLHYPTLEALRGAANDGVDVRIVMDDDVVLGQSEVQGVTDFYNSQLKTSKIKIRFAETNAQAGDSRAQMMHNKLTILNGKRTFSGAGHFTNAALQNNWENFYLIENRGLTKKYLIYFQELWEKSVSESKVKGGKDQPAKELSPEALKIINGNG